MRFRLKLAPLTLLSLMAFAILLSPQLLAGDDRAEAPTETEVFRLQHMDTKTAVTMLRAILQVRQMAEIVETQTIVIQERPEIVEAARKLVQEVDRPARSWSMDLMVETASGEQRIRTVDLNQEPISLTFGTEGPSHFNLSVDAPDRSPGALRANYRIVTQLALGDSERRFNFSESAQAILDEDEVLVLLEPELPSLKTELARVLGFEGEARSLTLRFHRDG